MKRKPAILVVAVALAVAVSAIVAWGIYAGLLGVCENNDYTIWLRRIPSNETVSRFVNLSADDLAAHPLIGDALKAYQNPAAFPGAHFEGDYLLWRRVTPPGDTSVRETNDFLVQRFGGGRTL